MQKCTEPHTCHQLLLQQMAAGMRGQSQAPSSLKQSDGSEPKGINWVSSSPGSPLSEKQAPDQEPRVHSFSSSPESRVPEGLSAQSPRTQDSKTHGASTSVDARMEEREQDESALRRREEAQEEALAKRAGEQEDNHAAAAQEQHSASATTPAVPVMGYKDKNQEVTDKFKNEMLGFFVQMAPHMKMFTGVDIRLLHRLSSRLEVIKAPADVRLVEAGIEGHSMFFLINGECEVFVTGKKVCSLNAPCCFGEIALLLSEKRSADVHTKTPCWLCELARVSSCEVLCWMPARVQMYIDARMDCPCSC